MLKVLLFISSSFFIANCFSNDQVEKVLNDFHQAAAEANYDQYFSLLAEEGIFLGTDAKERWSKSEFSEYVKPLFSKGISWSYVPTKRNITAIQGTDIVYFDELLLNDNYGECRGTGVLIKKNNSWKILQYNLTVTVPNNISKQVVSLIQSSNK